MRVVFDANIVISALVFPGKQADKAFTAIIEGRDRLLISKPIVNEVVQVLARKFARDTEELARVAVLLADPGEMIVPSRRISLLTDDADNRILECAVRKAYLIVTGDQKMPGLGSFEQIGLVSLRQYLRS